MRTARSWASKASPRWPLAPPLSPSRPCARPSSAASTPSAPPLRTTTCPWSSSRSADFVPPASCRRLFPLLRTLALVFPPLLLEFTPVMGSLHLAVDIDAPRDRVFVFFVPQRMPLWYAPEMETEFELAAGESDFRVGLKVRISGRLGKREVTLTAVVQRYDWLRSLEWEFQDAYGVRGRQIWEVEDAPGIGGAGKAPVPVRIGGAGKAPVPVRIGGAGKAPVQIGMRTRVAMHEWYTFPGRLGRWLDPILMRPSIRARDKRMLAN